MRSGFDEIQKQIDTVAMSKKNVIALVDCDSFFVSCEQKVNPELKGKAVCVLSNRDGCVISRSKKKKKMGIRMGLPYFMAKKDFPKCVYLSGRHDLYGEVSKEVMAVLKEFSPKVEVYSIDEAFVELTGLERLYKKNYTEIGEFLREEVIKRVDIPVSIGISSSKTLAKLASDKAKSMTGGVYHIHKGEIIDVLENTEIGEIWGIGKNLTLMFHKNGIINAYELVSQTDTWLNKKIGIRGLEMKHELMGEMVSPVDTSVKLPKSIQKTSMLSKFSSDINFLKNSLNYHIHRACAKLRKLDAKCTGITLMLKTKDFKSYYEKRIIAKPTDFELEISGIIFELLDKMYNPNVLYRSTGVILDGITQNSEAQLFLFSDNSADEKKSRLTKCFDNLENRFGKNIIRTGFTPD